MLFRDRVSLNAPKAKSMRFQRLHLVIVVLEYIYDHSWLSVTQVMIYE